MEDVRANGLASVEPPRLAPVTAAVLAPDVNSDDQVNAPSKHQENQSSERYEAEDDGRDAKDEHEAPEGEHKTGVPRKRVGQVGAIHHQPYRSPKKITTAADSSMKVAPAITRPLAISWRGRPQRLCLTAFSHLLSARGFIAIIRP